MRVLSWWFDWGIWLGVVVAVVAIFWILYDSRRRGLTATNWLAVAVVGAIMMLPTLYLALSITAAANLLLSNPNLLIALGWVGVAGMAVCLVAGIGYWNWASRGAGAGGFAQPYYPPAGGGGGYLPPTQTSPAPPPSVPAPAPTRGPVVAPMPRTEVMGQQPAATAWLVARSGARANKQWGLNPSLRSTIGRDGTRCDIILDDPSVSGEHACVQWENGQFILHDLASRNGTFLNGNRVQRMSLMDGDVVRVGDTTLVFKLVR